MNMHTPIVPPAQGIAPPAQGIQPHLRLIRSTPAPAVQGVEDDDPRPDLRLVQATWDVEALTQPAAPDHDAPDHDAQFRAINAALLGTNPERTPLALAVASAIGGAILIAGVITGFAWFIRAYARARGIW